MKITEFKLNESLFNEDKDIDIPENYNQIPKDTIDYIFKGTNIDKISKNTLQMIKNPYKGYGTDPYTGRKRSHILLKEAFIILRLYELTMWNTNNPFVIQGNPYKDPFSGQIFNPAYGVKRSDLLRMAGVANPDTPGEGGTYWMDFKDIGLGYLGDTVGNQAGYVFPGSRLEPYVTGCLDSSYGAHYQKGKGNFMPFENSTSMEADLGNLPDRPRVTPSASKTRNPGTTENPFDKILPSSKVIEPEKKKKDEDEPYDGYNETHIDPEPTTEPVVEPVVEPVTPPEPKEYQKFNMDRFRRNKKTEDLTEDFTSDYLTVSPTELELNGDAYLLDDFANFLNTVISAYKEWRHLPADADISDNYNGDDFGAVCSVNQWPLSIREQIWKDRLFE